MQVFYSKRLHERANYHVCLLQKYLLKMCSVVVSDYRVFSLNCNCVSL